MRKLSLGRKIFLICNTLIISFMVCVTIVPIIHVLAKSFSDSSAIMRNEVALFPVNFTTVS